MRVFTFYMPIVILFLACPIQAQSAATAPTATAPSDIEKLQATCIRVKGKAQYAHVGAKATDAKAWKPLKVGETYGDGIQIRTAFRSSVSFKFGDDTYVEVGRSTLAALTTLHRSGNKKVTRIGLDYGEVRGGVAETEEGLRSDFEIDSPLATLSKRGTEGFSLYVERGTGRFQARLADSGLVEVLHKTTGRRQRIRPNQWVTQAMLNWADQAKYNRQIVVADVFSQTADEFAAFARSNSGLTGLSPSGTVSGGAQTGGTAVNQQSLAAQRASFERSQALRQSQLQALNLFQQVGGDVPTTDRVPSDDGNFGTGSPFATSAKQRLMQRTSRVIGHLLRRKR